MSSAKLQPVVVRVTDVLAVFLAMFAVTVRPMFSGLAAPLHRNILIYLLVFMSALLVTLRLALGKRLALPAPALTFSLLGFIVVTAAAAFLADYRFGAVVRTLDIIAWAVLAVVLIQRVSTPFRGRIVLAALVATLAVLAADGFHQHFAALPDIQRDLAEHIRRMTDSGTLHPSLIRTMEKRATSGDVFGEFVIANSFAGYLIILLPAAFALAVATWRERKGRISIPAAAAGLAALAGLAVLFLTKSKGGILALAAAAALGGVLYLFRRVAGRKTAAAAALLLAACLLTAQGVPTDDNTTTRSGRRFWLGDSAEVRVEYWKGGWEVFKRHPWLGVGPGNFADHYLACRTPEGSETRYAHNDYLEIATETGLVGLVVYLGVWGAWFVSMGRRTPGTLPAADDEDPKSRRAFVIVVGLVGVTAVFFTMGRFIPTGETRVMTFVGVLVWLVVYGVQVRHVLRVEGTGDARLLRGALTVGACAFLLHSAIDFDFNVPGVTYPLGAVLAVGLALRERQAEREPRPLGTGGQVGLTLSAAVPIALALWLLFYPLIDMSIALEEAQLARRTHAERLQEAEDALKRGDRRTHEEKLREAGEILTVQLPGHLREAMAKFPANPEPYLELARLEAAALRNDPTADLSAVEELLDRAKRLRPHDPTPCLLLAQLITARMNVAEARGQAGLVQSLAGRALRQIDQAVSLYPTHPGTRCIRARLLEKLSRRREAVEEYEKALDLADRTSEKELKFPPEEVRAIRQTIRRLEGTSN